MTQGPTQGSTRIYSLVSTIFLVLTALTLCGVIGYAVAGPKGAGLQPTLIGIPTTTPTLVGPTAPATWTPAPFPTATATRPATRTPSPSDTPTPTETSTATNTLTPSNTPPATNTRPPTATSEREEFDYTLQDGDPVLKKNDKFDGCDAVIAGVVKDVNGKQTTQTGHGLRVAVTGNKENTTVRVGAHTEYGQSGWEYYFNDHAIKRTYHLHLEYSDGTAASDVWDITTSAACNKNLAFVTFIQVQERAD